MPVKDPTSDMAVFSKKGSQLMRDVRERRERERATKEKFNMAGTVIGNILGVKEEKVEEGTGQRTDVQDDAYSSALKADAAGAGDDDDEGGEGGDYKKDSMYAHGEAQTAFHGLPWPSMAFHGLTCPSMGFHGLPWPSMPFDGLL
jgi:hypothetical protein